MAPNLTRFKKDHEFSRGMILTLQDSPLPIADDITALNWQDGLEVF